MAKTTPAMMRPILAPDVILTEESFKRSGRVSTADVDRRGQDKRDQSERRHLEKRRTVDEPEKCTGGKSAAGEGEERGDENCSPDGNAATEVSAVAHRVVVKSR